MYILKIIDFYKIKFILEKTNFSALVFFKMLPLFWIISITCSYRKQKALLYFLIIVLRPWSTILFPASVCMFPINFAKIKLFFIFQTKSCLSASVFIFSAVSQLLYTKFYLFWTQKCRNVKSIQFSNFPYVTCS